MSMGTDHGPDQEPEKYSFLQEKIKDETMNKKKMLGKISWLVGKGVLFGIAASIGFFALKPWAETAFQKNPDKIEIPKDDDIENIEPEDKNEEPVQQVLTIENYRELNSALVQTSFEAQKSVVEVMAVHADGSMMNEEESWKHQSAGVIVADNGPELLILTNADILSEAEGLKVKFADHTEYSAALKKKDANIGMAVLSVDKTQIKEATWARIQVAELGNSNALGLGKTVIALGNPMGYSDGMAFGAVSSNKENITLADGEYRLVVTDMPGTAQSSGVLFNIDGQVVGIIVKTAGEQMINGPLTAYGISSIKGEIELMSNAKDVPYIGLIGELVTEEISKQKNIPKGICVTEVETDSPAMKAGIQNGDIITEIDKTKIETFIGYHSAMITKEIGEEITLKGQRRGAEGYVEISFTVTVGIKE